MTKRSQWVFASIAAVLMVLLAACNTGGGTTTLPPLPESFSLTVTATPQSGLSPLKVTFFAVPSGGETPYTYAWDFDNDGVIDRTKSDGVHVYVGDGLAKVTVTDANGDVVTDSVTIIITGVADPGSGGSVGKPLEVLFNAIPQVGNVPFEVQFTSFVPGGKGPYSFAWDFDGDGEFDNFTQNPTFIFQEVGQAVAEGISVHYPVLQVTDSRGIVGTNLDDRDGDGQADNRVAINALRKTGELTVTGLANPQAGQAPLLVEFTGAVTGGSGNYEFSWEFGDGGETDFAKTSIVTHTFVAQGTYLARVTVHDIDAGETKSSAPITITASPKQELSLTIDADITIGSVPFVVNFQANPVNGAEPIIYQWDVFDDDPINPEPNLAFPPSLNGAAVVTPDFTFRKNPAIHFGNTAGAAGSYNYIARCVATDNLGNTAVSNLIRVVAQPRTDPTYYEAHRAQVVARTFFPVFRDPNLSANAAVEAITPQNWSPRANAAVVSHPSGISWIVGGEILDENGDFVRLVLRGDSMYMYVPRQQATGTNQSNIGKFNQGGGIIRLNDSPGPAFPRTPRMGGPNSGYPADGMDTRVPPQQDPNQPPASAPPLPTQRSAAFTIVGSAAAVFMHERPETNEEDEYPGPGQWDGVSIPPTDDSLIVGYPQSLLWAWPDCPSTGWNLDNPMVPPGFGSPVIYVLGGRVRERDPVAQLDDRGELRGLIQKYYIHGFGSEDVIPWSLEYDFQTTGNQVDIWSPDFLRPDTDQFPGSGTNFDPQIDTRVPGQGGGAQTGEMPMLPTPLYGLMACKIETRVDLPAPTFPNGPFRYIFIFGGIDADGAVSNEMRWWDVSLSASRGGGGTEEEPGIFSLVSTMPSARAYGKAVLIPTGSYRIALIGGLDVNGIPMNTVDIFTFDSNLSPSTGSWETFAGTLPEALVASGAGYNPGFPGQPWVVAFSGWTGEKFSSATRTVRLNSQGNQIILEAIKAVPRSHVGSGQSGGFFLPPNVPNFNRYYLFGGVDENGVENIVEVLSLP